MPHPPKLAGIGVARGSLALLLAAAAAAVSLYVAGPRIAGLLAATACVAAPAAAVSIGIGVTVALLIAKSDVPGRRFALAALGGLTLTPLTVLATGWLAAVGEGGWLASWLVGDRPTRGVLSGYAGAAWLHGLAGAPWVTLITVAIFNAVDRRREEQGLIETGAGRVLRRVTLRDAAPGIALAGVFVAIQTAGEMTFTDLLGVRTFAEEVYTQAATGQLGPTLGGGWRLAAGVGVLVILACSCWACLIAWLPANDTTGPGRPWRAPTRRWRFATALLCVLVGGLAVFPVASLVARAGVVTREAEGGFQRVWSPSKAATTIATAPWQHRRELRVSVTLAVSVATAATAVGFAGAWFARGGFLRALGVAILTSALLATPGPVVGLAVIRLLNQPPDSPLWLLGDLYGTWFAPWMAQLVRVAPYATLVVWPAVASVPTDLLQAARSEGASWPNCLLWVAAPLARGGLAASWFVAFALSLGELAATVLVAPPGTPPLSVRLLSLLHYGVEDRVAAICLWLVVGYGGIALVVLSLAPKRWRLD